MRGLPFDRKIEALLVGRSDVALIVRPMLVAWRQLRKQITAFNTRKAARTNLLHKRPAILVAFYVVADLLSPCIESRGLNLSRNRM
jgi:hypothetical protein